MVRPSHKQLHPESDGSLVCYKYMKYSRSFFPCFTSPDLTTSALTIGPHLVITFLPTDDTIWSHNRTLTTEDRRLATKKSANKTIPPSPSQSPNLDPSHITEQQSCARKKEVLEESRRQTMSVERAEVPGGLPSTEGESYGIKRK
jgi:hypothetical protein